MSMWTKLRPFVREFLAAASAIAEMHIYTHGDQSYSAAMGKVLDPGRTYFQERIMSSVSPPPPPPPPLPTSPTQRSTMQCPRGGGGHKALL